MPSGPGGLSIVLAKGVVGNDDLIQQGQVQGRRQGDERYPEDRQQGGRYQEDRHGEDAGDDDDLEDVPVTEDNLQVLTS